MANNVQIDITARDNASAAIGKVTGALSKLGTMAAAAIVAATTATVAFVGQSILYAGRVQELATVNQVLAKNAGLSADSVVLAAAAVRKMGIEADVSQQVVAQFVRSNLDLSKASDLARIAQDAATISGMNSTEALNGMINGIITLQPEMVRTAGLTVQFINAEKKLAEQLGISVQDLNIEQKQFAALNSVLEAGITVQGAYEAAQQKGAKIIRSYPRLLKDIMLAVGEPFQNAFDKSAKSVELFLKSMVPLVGKLQGMNFEEITAAISKGIDSIDFGKLSDGLVKSINSINWAEMGRQLRSGLEVLNKSLGDAFNEIKWGDIGKSAATGAMNIIAGFTNQGSWDNVKKTWAFNSQSLLNLISVWGARWKAAIPKLAVEVFFPGPGVFQQAAAQIAAGMALVNAAFGGGAGYSGFTGGGGPKPPPIPATASASSGSGGRKRAAGGSVKKGEDYWVGEEGPEPFMPSQNGTIIPNNRAGSMVVNLTYAPAFSTASQSEFEKAITPMLNNWYRSRLTS